MKKTTVLCISLAFLLGLIGCASTNEGSPADKMWIEGQKQSEEGEKLQIKGQERVSKGQKQVRDGEAMVQRGTQLVEQSRQEYQVQSRSAGSSINPEQILYESKQLDRIANRWKDGKNLIKDGNNLKDKGNTNIQKGTGELSKARSLIDSGLSKMTNSQRYRQNETLQENATSSSIEEEIQSQLPGIADETEPLATP
ncbi:MAG: hypothetical protein ACRBCS_14670 [Cellvibrionaceae bacterium]